MDKQAIKRSFSRAAHTYSRSSFVQKEVGRILLNRLIDILMGVNPRRILELGCGDGTAATAILETFSPSHMVLVDISHGMLQVAKRRLLHWAYQAETEFSYINMDMEDIKNAFLPNIFDVVYSNSALHWVTDLSGVLEAIETLLRPGGLFACTIFTQNTLKELSEISFEIIGTRALSSKFLSPHQIRSALSTFFTPVWDSTSTMIRAYRDIWSLLKTLKGAGVTPRGAARADKILLRRDLFEMERLFNRRYGGILVGYQVVFFVGRKKEGDHLLRK